MVELRSQRCTNEAEISISRSDKVLVMCGLVLGLMFLLFHNVEATVDKDLEIIADRINIGDYDDVLQNGESLFGGLSPRKPEKRVTSFGFEQGQ